MVVLTSVTPKGMFPTYSLRACLLIALPAKGMVVLSVMDAGGTTSCWGMFAEARWGEITGFKYWFNVEQSVASLR